MEAVLVRAEVRDRVLLHRACNSYPALGAAYSLLDNEHEGAARQNVVTLLHLFQTF